MAQRPAESSVALHMPKCCCLKHEPQHKRMYELRLLVGYAYGRSCVRRRDRLLYAPWHQIALSPSILDLSARLIDLVHSDKMCVYRTMC
eukprot:scaffold69693_cov39-Tisochrysis_lutea.AAC.2